MVFRHNESSDRTYFQALQSTLLILIDFFLDRETIQQEKF